MGERKQNELAEFIGDAISKYNYEDAIEADKARIIERIYDWANKNEIGVTKEYIKRRIDELLGYEMGDLVDNLKVARYNDIPNREEPRYVEQPIIQGAQEVTEENVQAKQTEPDEAWQYSLFDLPIPDDVYQEQQPKDNQTVTQKSTKQARPSPSEELPLFATTTGEDVTKAADIQSVTDNEPVTVATSATVGRPAEVALGGVGGEQTGVVVDEPNVAGQVSKRGKKALSPKTEPEKIEIPVNIKRKIAYDKESRTAYPSGPSGGIAKFSIPALVDAAVLAKAKRTKSSIYSTVKFTKSDGGVVSVGSIDDFIKVAKADTANDTVDFAALSSRKKGRVLIDTVPNRIKYAIALGRANVIAEKGKADNKNAGKRAIDEQVEYIANYVKAYEELYGGLSDADKETLVSYLTDVYAQMTSTGANSEATPDKLEPLFNKKALKRNVESDIPITGNPAEQQSVYERGVVYDEEDTGDGTQIAYEGQGSHEVAPAIDVTYASAITDRSMVKEALDEQTVAEKLERYKNQLIEGGLVERAAIRGHLTTLAKVLVADDKTLEKIKRELGNIDIDADRETYAAVYAPATERAVKNVKLSEEITAKINDIASRANQEAIVKRVNTSLEKSDVDEKAVSKTVSDAPTLLEVLYDKIHENDAKGVNDAFLDIDERFTGLLESLGHDVNNYTEDSETGKIFRKFDEIKQRLNTKDEAAFGEARDDLYKLITDVIDKKLKDDLTADTPFKRGIKLISLYNQALDKSIRNQESETKIALPREIKEALFGKTTTKDKKFAKENAGKTWREIAKSIPEFTVSKKIVETPTDPVLLRGAIKQMTGVRNLPFVNIFSSTETLSKHLSMSVPSNAAGLVYGGKVYLVTKNIAKGDEISVLAHELGVHVAAERYLDARDFSGFASEILLLSEKGDRAAIAAVEAAERSIKAANIQKYDAEYAGRYTRELVANYVEQTYSAAKKPSLFQRIVRWVANLLNKAGLKIKPQFVAEHLKEIVDGMIGRLVTDRGYGAEYDGGAHALSYRSPFYSAAKAPDEETIIGGATYNSGAQKTGAIRSAVEATKRIFSPTTLSNIDIATNTLENLVDEVERRTTYAARMAKQNNTELISPFDGKLLPSIKPLMNLIERRSEEIKSITFSNDAIQHMLNGLDEKFRNDVTKIATLMRRYELWAFDPSDWHPAIWSEDRIEAYINDKKQTVQNYDPNADEFVKNKYKLLDEIRASIRKQIDDGNLLHKNGKPVSSVLVAWRFNNLKNGLSADGNKLSDSEANQARRAATAIEMIFRELYEVDKRALEATTEQLKPILTSIFYAKKALLRINALLNAKTLKKDDGLQALPKDVVEMLENIAGGVRVRPNTTIEDLAKKLERIAEDEGNIRAVTSYAALMKRYMNRTTPYTPHVRIGDYFLIAKSQLYRFLEQMATARAIYKNGLRKGNTTSSPLEIEKLVTAYVSRAQAELQTLTDAAAGDYVDFVKEIKKARHSVDGLLEIVKDDMLWDEYKMTPTIESVKKDADHYAVFSFLTRAERMSVQQRIQNALSNNDGNPTNIILESLNKTEALEQSRATSEALSSVLALVRTTSTDDQTIELVENAVYRMYLSLFTDLITVQSRRYARNVFGYMHSYTPLSISKYIRETANYVAAIKYDADIEETIAALRAEAKRPFPILDDRDRELASAYVNTIISRWNQFRNRGEPQPLVEGMLTASSVWTLTTNLSYFLGNALQNHVVAAPLIGGLGWKVGNKFKFVGEARALSKLHEALKITIPSVVKTSSEFEKLVEGKMQRGETITAEDYKQLIPQEHVKASIKANFKAKYGADYAAFLSDVIDTLSRRGLLDMGLYVDMGDVDAVVGVLGEKGMTKRVAATFAKLPEAGRKISQAIEVANRSAAVIATIESLIEAGNLDRKELTPRQMDELRDKALMIIQDAHGNYSSLSRPTWFASRNILLKLAMQFRYYSHILLRTLIKLAKYSLSKELTTEEERQMYRRMFTRLMLHTMVLFGVRGLPLIGPMMALLWAVGLACGDEAECEKMNAMDTSAGMDYRIRKALGDNAFADFISGGLATMLLRLDVSARFGMANIGGIMPFEESYITDLFKSYNDYLESTVKLAFGAFGGMLGNMVRGIDLISKYPDGSYNTWKGLAFIAPVGFRNMINSLLWYMYGIRTRSGNPILDKEDINIYEAAMKAIGFQPKVAADAYAKYGSLIELKKHVSERTALLKQRIFELVMRGERDRVRELIPEIIELRKLQRKLGFPDESLTGDGIRKYVITKLKQQKKDARYADMLFEVDQIN